VSLLSFYFPYREAFESRKISADQNGAYEDRVYYVWQTDPEFIWWSNMLPKWMSPHPDGLLMSNFFAESIAVDPPTKGLPNECRVTIRYREYTYGLTPAGEDWQFDYVSQQMHISSVPNDSYAIHYPPTAYAGLAIGTDGERTEGTDVMRRVETIVVTKMWTNIDRVGRYILASLANTVNSRYWFDYQPGEVLFTGSQVRRMPNGLVKVQYNFTARRYQPAFPVQLYTGEVVPVEPRPWDYVWYRYLDTSSTDTETNEETEAKGIRSIHINQVYDFADLHVLGLSGPYG
jgi:hypothetical protein